MNEKHFINKICTILTHPVNFNTSDQTSLINMFTGIVEHIDEKTILLKSLDNYTKTIFYKMHVVGILEEEVMKKDDPKLQEIKKAVPSGDIMTLNDLQALVNK